MFSNIDTDSSGTIDESELTTFVNDLTEKTGIEIDIDEALSTYDSGANINFESLRYVAERTLVGEKREALFAVTIPERPG